MTTMANPEALVNQAIGELKLGHKDEARQLLRNAVENDPSNERGWLYLSTTLPATQALEALQKVLEINPQNQQAIRAITALSNRATAIPGPGDDIPTTIPVTPSPIPLEVERRNKPEENLKNYNYENFFTATPTIAEPISRPDNSANKLWQSNEGFIPFGPSKEAEDLRAVLTKPYTTRSTSQTKSSNLALIVGGIIVVCLVVGVSLYFLFFNTSPATPDTQPNPTQLAQSNATLTAAVSTSVAATPTLAPTTAPIPTLVLPTVVPEQAILPTPTALPNLINLQVVQNQPAKLNGLTLTFSSYDNHSASFADGGAGKARTGTHFEGAVVVIENTYTKALALNVKQFQAVDGRNNYAAALETGRLPALDLPRLQPGERRAAWLTFEVGDGTTLRAIIFNPATETDTNNSVLVNLVAPPFKSTSNAGSTPTSSKNTSTPTPEDTTSPTTPVASSPTPNAQSSIGKRNTLNNGVALTVVSYNAAPTVHPFILPANYHYEAVQIKVENTDTKNITDYLKSYPFYLRDSDGYVYSVGPLTNTGPEHFDPTKFTANGKTPAATKLTGTIYLLVRDNAHKQPRQLIWYASSEVSAERIEVNLN
jgi:hypothetical protein